MVMIQKVLERYGNTIVNHTQGVSFRGFLQGTTARGLRNMERKFSPLGQIPDGQVVLLAPAKTEIHEGDVLSQGDLIIVVNKMEVMMVNDEPLYQWGLCRKKGGADTWGPD